MALPATHIRFALDLKKHLGVIDHKTYIAGTLYPDSRYITKVDRSVSHDEGLLDVLRDKTSNDFEKGWAVHLVCDILQEEERVKHFFSFLPLAESTDWWTSITAMKIMADMDDVQYINAAGELGYLSIQTPNGELKELVEQYHQLNRLTYHKNGVPEREDYRAFWESLASTHYDKSVFDEIFTKLDDYLKNEEIVSTINTFYDSMLKNAARYL